MSDRIELKVGDRVRLLGECWETERHIPYGTVVTVDYMAGRSAWSDHVDVGWVLHWDGEPFPGWPIEKVEDADDSNEQAAADARAVMNVHARYGEALRANMASHQSMQVLVSDVGALLRIADEYEALKRSLVGRGGR